MKNRIKLFIGPCVLESLDLAMEVASKMVHDLYPFKDDVELTFKGSYDKANRTSIDSYRGPGIEEGLKILEKIKKEFSLSILCDFHTPNEAKSLSQVVDTLQVPAFLCRQTDMIIEGARWAAYYGRNLKIKKGQFMAPHDMGHSVKKAQKYLPLDKILLTERGTSFGYNNLIVDMSSFQTMKSFGVKVIFDATHSVQRPGGSGNVSGGKREQIVTLARAAMAAGADGLFIEVHPDPQRALSDAHSMLKLTKLKEVVSQLIKIYQVISDF